MQTQIDRALVGNPLRAVRHMEGLHRRVVADKRVYSRRVKHPGRDDR